MAKKRAGVKGKSQTPAPKKERIKGSKTNKTGSASASARSTITFSESLTNKLKSFLKVYNKANPTKKITGFLLATRPWSTPSTTNFFSM